MAVEAMDKHHASFPNEKKKRLKIGSGSTTDAIPPSGSNTNPGMNSKLRNSLFLLLIIVFKHRESLLRTNRPLANCEKCNISEKDSKSFQRDNMKAS
jgi:hypothetical protein